MFKHYLSTVILYCGMMCIYTKCKDLESKLAIKTYEAELYKALLQQSIDPKNEKKKEK